MAFVTRKLTGTSKLLQHPKNTLGPVFLPLDIPQALALPCNKNFKSFSVTPAPVSYYSSGIITGATISRKDKDFNLDNWLNQFHLMHVHLKHHFFLFQNTSDYILSDYILSNFSSHLCFQLRILRSLSYNSLLKTNSVFYY